MDKLFFNYTFEFKDETSLEYRIDIDPRDVSIITNHNPESSPVWTKLEYHQCDSCTMKNTEHCPVALNLQELLDRFKTVKSYVECKITVESQQRNYYLDADVQTGLGSIFGLLIATSACPVMSFFKPMAKFHLPFASTEETIFRSFGSFFIRAYFDGRFSKSEILERLRSDYDKVREVNSHLVERFSHLVEDDDVGDEAGDANVNAIVILDTFASMIELELGDDLDLLHHMIDQSDDAA